jgi:hypothetical protein
MSSPAIVRRAQILQTLLGVDFATAEEAVTALYGPTAGGRTAASIVDILGRINYLDTVGTQTAEAALLRAEILSAHKFPSGYNLIAGRTAGVADPILSQALGSMDDLSRSIWKIKGNARQQIADTIRQGLLQGRSQAAIARDVEKYMYAKWKPTRSAGRITSAWKERGAIAKGRGGASWQARRLVRTEITKAHTAMVESSMQDHPFIGGVNWVRTTHGRADICEENEAHSPYTFDVDYPKPPAHPNCMCRLVVVYKRGYASAADDIRNMLEAEEFADVDIEEDD